MRTTKRIAAKLLKVGISRIRVKPDETKRAKEALTTDDVRTLIKEGIVWAMKKKGVPRGKARMRAKKRKKGRMRGEGSRKGSYYAKRSRKREWILKVRAQRELLKKLRMKRRLAEGIYRRIYRMIKGGAFRSRAALVTHLKEHGFLKEK